MEIKILQVFYGKDGLPYKDKDRQVHFPILGTGFLGASNTTKIKFYYDELDETNQTTWVAVSKLPNGRVGSRVLESYLDEELNEHYALLELDNYYTQYKGDVFISLQGYQGGVNVDYDEENSQYEIHGTPTIAATGSIKFTINYANQFVGSGETDNINFQRVLAALGTKLGMRAYSEHVEELPSEGSPDVFYVINDDADNPTLANIYVWNENTQHYIWVGDNSLYLGNYYPKASGERLEQELEDTNDRIDQLGAAYIFKGAKTVAQINALTGMTAGDAYNVTDSGTITTGSVVVSAGDNVAWNGTAWDKLSNSIDLSGYATKEYVTQNYQKKLTAGTNIYIDQETGVISASGNTVIKIDEETGLPYATENDLPTASAGTMGAIYLVASASPTTENQCDEYITIHNESNDTYKWECIGNTSVDLTDYCTLNTEQAFTAKKTFDSGIKTTSVEAKTNNSGSIGSSSYQFNAVYSQQFRCSSVGYVAQATSYIDGGIKSYLDFYSGGTAFRILNGKAWFLNAIRSPNGGEIDLDKINGTTVTVTSQDTAITVYKHINLGIDGIVKGVLKLETSVNANISSNTTVATISEEPSFDVYVNGVDTSANSHLFKIDTSGNIVSVHGLDPDEIYCIQILY